MDSVVCLRLYEAGKSYTLPRAVAHAAAKRGLVARARPPDWSPPSILKSPEVLTEADVVEAEAELRALQPHSLEVVDPEADDQLHRLRRQLDLSSGPALCKCEHPACTPPIRLFFGAMVG